MNRWKEQLENHAINKTLIDLLSFVEVTLDDTNADLEIEKRRIIKVLRVFQYALTQLDPELVPFNLLDNLNQNLGHQNIWNQLKMFSQNGNYQHLTNANNHINHCLNNLVQLTALAEKSISEKPIKGLEEEVDAFTKTIDEKKNNLEKNVNNANATAYNVEKRLEELLNAVDVNKQQTNKLITSWQDQFNGDQKRRNEEFANDKITRNAQHLQLIRQIETNTKKEISDLISGSQEKLYQSKKDFDQKIGEYISNATDKHNEILDLYELVAGDSVASGYLKNAEDERKQANLWRWIAIFFINITVGWTALSFFLGNTINEQGIILWGQVIKAFSVTGVLLFGAAYSARQSNVHRQNEKKTRWFALEIKAIDPFIASLGEEDRKALKNKLSERLFGHHNGEDDKDHKIIDEHAFSTIVKGITDILKAK